MNNFKIALTAILIGCSATQCFARENLETQKFVFFGGAGLKISTISAEETKTKCGFSFGGGADYFFTKSHNFAIESSLNFDFYSWTGGEAYLTQSLNLLKIPLKAVYAFHIGDLSDDYSLEISAGPFMNLGCSSIVKTKINNKEKTQVKSFGDVGYNSFMYGIETGCRMNFSDIALGLTVDIGLNEWNHDKYMPSTKVNSYNIELLFRF